MRVTLKRAHFLDKSARKLITDGKYDTVETVSVYSPVMADPSMPGRANEMIAKARQKLLDQHNLAMALITAAHAIREQVGEANQRYGISTNLTRKARYTMEEARVRALLAAMTENPRNSSDPSVAVALTKAAALRDQPKDSYLSDRDNVRIALLNENDADGLRRQLKRILDARAIIQDAIDAANGSHTITLDDTTVATLRQADLLPEDDVLA